MVGSINIYGNHRTYYNKCLYWACKVKNTEPNTITSENEPSGTFWAKEKAPRYSKKDIVSESFMLDNNTMVLETKDCVDDMKPNYLVKYDDRIWRVSTIQRKKVNRRNQLISNRSYIYTINLEG